MSTLRREGTKEYWVVTCETGHVSTCYTVETLEKAKVLKKKCEGGKTKGEWGCIPIKHRIVKVEWL